MYGSKMQSRQIPPEAFNPRRDKVFIGGMFVFQYDAKHKNKLKWWDALPVVIPINLYNDGFLGLNLHYLPPQGRELLMSKLMEYKKKALHPRAYMALSYKMLNAAAGSKLFAPCVHRYLGNQITSKILRVDDQYWDKVAMLPIQQFQKASAQQVWSA